ncbi:MAG TPA: hypothetical protein VH518_25400 [Tepidisphaeraceae bacterium]|jgi:hypothetical protein
MRNRIFGIGVVFVLLVLLGSPVLAQTATHWEVSFNENGQGFIRPAPVGDPATIISLGKGPDPVDPGNGLLPLRYDLSHSPGFGGAVPVPGDVIITESTSPFIVSDLLRFTPTGILVVYSDLPEPGETPDLADVGFPGVFVANAISMPETGTEGGLNGLFGYTPTPNQPGFVVLSPFAGTVVYNFTSDVPEPAAVVACALCFAGIFHRRRH